MRESLLREVHDLARHRTLGCVRHMQLRLDGAQNLPRLSGDGIGPIGRHLVDAEIDQRFPQQFFQGAGLKRWNDGYGSAFRLPNECALAVC